MYGLLLIILLLLFSLFDPVLDPVTGKLKQITEGRHKKSTFVIFLWKLVLLLGDEIASWVYYSFFLIGRFVVAVCTARVQSMSFQEDYGLTFKHNIIYLLAKSICFATQHAGLLTKRTSAL